MQKIDLRVDVRYQVLKGGDNGDLHAGHRIVPEKDGSLAVILVADNPLWWSTHLKDIPASEVDAALVGAEIDVDREWLATQRQVALDILKPLEGL